MPVAGCLTRYDAQPEMSDGQLHLRIIGVDARPPARHQQEAHHHLVDQAIATHRHHSIHALKVGLVFHKLLSVAAVLGLYTGEKGTRK